MAKFKIGDRVIGKNGYTEYIVGEIGSAYDPSWGSRDILRVRSETSGHAYPTWYTTNMFVLAAPPTKTYTVTFEVEATSAENARFQAKHIDNLTAVVKEK